MPQRTRFPWPSPSVTVVLALFATAITSCSEDPPSGCPTFEIGAVTGRVLEAGRGVAVPVGARSLEGDDRGDLVAITTADSSGRFHLEVPTGLLRVEADPETWDRNPDDARDTLRVGPRVLRHDLLRGRATIRLGVPAELAGDAFTALITSPQNDRQSQTATVIDGAVLFSLPLLKPGRYSMHITAREFDQRFFLPGVADPATGDSLTVGTDSVAIWAADLTATYASIAGTVTGAWLAADAGGMQVHAVDADSVRVARVACGADGSFRLGTFLPQPVRLRTVHDGVVRWIGGDTYATARVFDLAPGDRIDDVAVVDSGIRVELSGPGDLTSHRARIVVVDDGGDEVATVESSPGPAAVCNLAPGRYRVLVDSECLDQIWASQWYDGAASLETATPVDLAEGQLVTLAVTLTAGGRIAGEVLTAAGGRPRAVSVRLADLDGQPYCTAQFPFGGFFEFVGLPDGDYYLFAREGDAMAWYPGVAELDEATAVTIVDHAVVDGVSWALPPAAEEGRP